MKSKTLSLVAGMVLVANVGFAQAAELDKTAGAPDILNGVVAHGATMMTPTEMEAVHGARPAVNMTGGSWFKGDRWVIKIYDDGSWKTKGCPPNWAKNAVGL